MVALPGLVGWALGVSAGVTLYVDSNFGGTCKSFDVGQYGDLTSYGLDQNDWLEFDQTRSMLFAHVAGSNVPEGVRFTIGSATPTHGTTPYGRPFPSSSTGTCSARRSVRVGGRDGKALESLS
jgi:hypothetical protein